MCASNDDWTNRRRSSCFTGLMNGRAMMIVAIMIRPYSGRRRVAV